MICTVVNKTSHKLQVRCNQTEQWILPSQNAEFECFGTEDFYVLPMGEPELTVQRREAKMIRAGKTFDMELVRNCSGTANLWFRLKTTDDCTVKIHSSRPLLKGLRLLQFRLNLFSAEPRNAIIEASGLYLNREDAATLIRAYRPLWISDIVHSILYLAITAGLTTVSIQHRNLLYLIPAALFLALVIGHFKNLFNWLFFQKQLNKTGFLDMETLKQKKQKN